MQWLQTDDRTSFTPNLLIEAYSGAAVAVPTKRKHKEVAPSNPASLPEKERSDGRDIVGDSWAESNAEFAEWMAIRAEEEINSILRGEGSEEGVESTVPSKS